MAKQGYWILAGGDVFNFDAVLLEQHAQEMQITREPLETGAVAADHIIIQPAHLALEVAVSDIALHPAADDAFASSNRRSAVALDKLKKLQATGEPFVVVTGMQLYSSMQLASITGDETAEMAGLFRLELEELRFVDTKTVTYPPRQAGKAARTAAPKTNGGQKDAPKVTDETRAVSILKSAGSSSDLASSLAKQLLGLDLGQAAP